ncbi:protein kinase domain-containing protein [Polyangium jinanense]|uniref:Serine/threonine protein kinase n=1 Tax=Polyangium jinanense TaxID=2829994 RepID=A0A9X4AR99_9BACT|nr:serine/threonine-protein kinase [Polyangium jinanense]MDC3954170.1 serine/threonine protein kinase [Polyangium jinanense]MDC3981874.1 serine/threonine protein kinase [Polyangium jinanense]
MNGARSDEMADTLDARAAKSHTRLGAGGSGEDRVPPAALRERYEELRLIGEGAMGTVFRGWDPRLGRAVALKLLKSDDPDDTRRFLAEARAQARVQHDNVCRVYEVGEADGEPYIAMELIDGVPLDRAHPEMTLEQKVKVIREVAAALHEAHRLGLAHRDVKPGNIMVTTAEDGSFKPYVVDFGLAREVSSSSGETLNNAIVGTPSYMSPEQAEGNTTLLDRRTDVYSLGATLYELIAGRTPFVGANAMSILTKVILEDAPGLGSIRRGVPTELETIVMTCLQRDPSRRYESARALGDDLQRFLDGEPIQAKRASVTYVLWAKARKNRAVVLVAGIGLSVALVLGGMWVNAARHASERARLARELGEDVKYVELFLRSAYGFPAHDIEREHRVVRARLAEIERRMAAAGRVGEGPGHYALGRGHLALHEYETARKQLERAFGAGYTKPEVHYALGLALGGRYQEELDGARRIEDGAAREAAIRRAEASFRDPALRHLRESGGTEVESRAYIEGLVALYEKRYDDAAAQARLAAEESPWLYEAKKLEGDARFEAGITASESGRQEDGRRLFAMAIDAYQAASAMARSDAVVHEALAEAWNQWLLLDIWEGRSHRASFEAALAACDAALASNPRSVSALRKKGRAHFHVGNTELRRGEDPRPTLESGIDIWLSAKRLSPEDAISDDGVGNAYTYIAQHERKIGLDPIPSLERAMKSFDEATRIEPTLVWAWNDAGFALLVRADHERDRGIDPRPSIDRAVERFLRAAKEDSTYIGSYSNTAFVLSIRASYELSIGQDPRPSVERAVEACARGAEINPKWLPMLNNRGWAELVAAQYEEATGADPIATLDRVEASFQASLDLNRDEADTHFGMGAAKHVRALYLLRTNADPQKALDDARAELRRAAQLDAREPAIRLELGLLTMAMARRAALRGEDASVLLDEAERVLREGLRINTRHAPLHAALAELLALRAESRTVDDASREKRLAEGLAAADEALRHNPKWALAMAAKGVLLAQRARAEDTRLAVEWLDKAIATNPLLPRRFMDRRADLRRAP